MALELREMTALFDIFPGTQAALVAAACRVMQERGLGPAEVLAQYDEYIRIQAAGQRPPAQAEQQGNTPRRTRAGDRAEVMGACPACGGTLELVQLCPQASPHWRTQAACLAEHCTWHGLSTEPISWLLAHKLQGLEAG